MNLPNKVVFQRRPSAFMNRLEFFHLPDALNGYREFDERHLERARFVVGARSLDLSLDDISEILAIQDQRAAPCRTLLDLIEQKADQIEERIRLLKQMEDDLRQLHKLG